MSKKNRQDNKGRSALEPGLTIPVEYVRAVDGDTIEVEIRRKFKLRLRDINVPEKNTDEGVEATEFVDGALLAGDDILVFIPTNSPDKLMDITSFERIVGDIYINGILLQDLLREQGYEI
jgi:endonuclease YncB( thermonuclease family)